MARLTTWISGQVLTAAALNAEFDNVEIANTFTIANITASAYGAVADDSTDNTTAIQAALNSGSPVYVPPTTSSFNYSTTLVVPEGVIFFGAGSSTTGQTGRPSTLKYTGTGSAMTLNAGNTSSAAWDATIANINLVGSASSLTGGIGLNNVGRVQIMGMNINTFTGGGGAIQATGTRGTYNITLIHNTMTGNSSCVHFATTGNSTDQNWRIIGNQCAACVSAGGRNAALDFNGIEVASMLLAGNAIDTNATPAEVFFGAGNMLGVTIEGNYINSTAAARNAIRCASTGTQNGVIIQGNEIYQSAATSTGRAIWFSAAGGRGVIVRGNYVANYASTANSAIDLGGFVFTDSDFSGNSIVGATADFGAPGIGSTLVYPVGIASIDTLTAAQSITVAGDTIAPSGDVKIVTNTTGGGITLTSAPSIPNGINGQRMTVMNVGTQNVVIQDQGTLASSNLRLNGTSVTIAPRQSIELMYSTTVGDWVQTGALVAVI